MLVLVLIFLSVLPAYLCVDLTYYVEEDKSPGTLVGDIAADSRLMDSIQVYDRNLIRFGQLGESVQLFRVAKKTGKLYTAQTLDAESLCGNNKECFKIIKVAVRRAKTFMRILKVKVIVQDINDHQPEFPEQRVDIEFSEESPKGARRSIPNAIDKDVGALNSQINYQLKKNIDEPFTLSVSKSLDGISKLSITLEERLDREIQDSYIVQVIAKDGGSPPKQSILDVHISVTDINDNAPVFSRNVYNVTVENERQVATPVIMLSAKDLDLGKNSQILYHFSSKTSSVAKAHFRLNSETGEIFLHEKFTAGQNPTYKLYIEAMDGGNPPLSSVAMVLVNLINQQNNAPSIDVNFFSASSENAAAIYEDVGVGSFIAYVMVTDSDFGPNGEVSCDLYHEKFQLLSLGIKEYKIIVKNPLDRETEDHHDIMINCQDKGSPPLHSESKFSIKVMDVNDEKPQFSEEIFKFWIDENQKSNFPVGSINATDPDLGVDGQLTFSLLTNNKDFLPFQITDRGLISTVMSLDHEFQDVYKFKVFVKDNGIPSLNNTANVIVEVRDENDNAPYFTFPSVNPYSLDVIYYPHHTNNITVLKASDIDSRENAFLKYEITKGNDKQLFTINHYTGLLSFSRVVTQQDTGSYDLQFVVKDSGTPVLSAKVDMILKLTVSNKTLELLSTKHMKSEKRIHLVLMIVIVLVAVTVSVSITAAMSICIIRCKDRRNASHRDEVNPSCKCITEQGHYMCPTQQSAEWPDVPIALSDTESSRSHTKRSRRGPFQGGELGNGQKIADGVYQVSTNVGEFISRA